MGPLGFSVDQLMVSLSAFSSLSFIYFFLFFSFLFFLFDLSIFSFIWGRKFIGFGLVWFGLVFFFFLATVGTGWFERGGFYSGGNNNVSLLFFGVLIELNSN